MSARVFTIMRRLSAFAMAGLLVVNCGSSGAAEAARPACDGDKGDPASGEVRSRAFGAFALSRDGGRFAVTVDDGRWSGLLVYQVETGRLLWQRALPGPASSMALSPNGEALALGYAIRPSRCPHVELLNGADGQGLVALQERGELSSVLNDAAQTVVFGPAGALVAAALDNEIRVWDAASGRNVSAIQPPGIDTRQGIEPIEELAISPDGKRIAGVSGRRPAVYLWELRTGRLERTLSLARIEGSFGSIVFNGDGSLLAAGSTGPIAIWSSRTGRLMGEISKPAAGPIGPVTFMGDGKLVVNGPGKLELWDVARRAPAPDPQWKPPAETVAAAFVIRSGELVGVVADAAWDTKPGHPGRIRLIAARTGRAISDLDVPGRSGASDSR